MAAMARSQLGQLAGNTRYNAIQASGATAVRKLQQALASQGAEELQGQKHPLSLALCCSQASQWDVEAVEAQAAFVYMIRLTTPISECCCGKTRRAS